MAVTIAVIRQESISGNWNRNSALPTTAPTASLQTTFRITGDSSYTTGGYAVTAAQLGLKLIHNVFHVQGVGEPTTGCVWRVNGIAAPATSVNIMANTAAAASVAVRQPVATSDISTWTAILIAQGV